MTNILPPPMHAVCYRCGSPNIARDATARWSFEEQDWSMSGVFDDITCQDCGNEVSECDMLPDAALSAAQRAFIYDGEDYVRPVEEPAIQPNNAMFINDILSGAAEVQHVDDSAVEDGVLKVICNDGRVLRLSVEGA